MHILGLTAGMACGKSTVSRAIRSMWAGSIFFDADACVRTMLDSDPTVASEIETAFGTGVVNPPGKIDRDALRTRVYDNPAEREKNSNPSFTPACLRNVLPPAPSLPPPSTSTRSVSSHSPSSRTSPPPSPGASIQVYLPPQIR